MIECFKLNCHTISRNYLTIYNYYNKKVFLYELLFIYFFLLVYKRKKKIFFYTPLIISIKNIIIKKKFTIKNK